MNLSQMASVQSMVSDRWGFAIRRDTLNHLVDETHTPTGQGDANGPAKAQGTPERIYEHFGQHLKLSGAPANFVFNIDEMVHRERANRKDTVCHVPRHKR